jgi:hypothetical protein
MSYERLNGMGWSEIPWLGLPGQSHKIGVCSGERVSRQICFVDNDTLEQATAERSGCVRAHRPWYQPSSINECRTTPAGNRGHVWCCPDNSPQPIPTTPEQRARDTELMLAEQQAAQEGRLPQTGTQSEPQKILPVDAETPTGLTQPVTQQETLLFTSTKLDRLVRNPGLIAAVAALGVGGYLAFRYFTHKHARPRTRRAAVLARVR